MYQVKENFKNQFKKNPYCDLCKIQKCSQRHLFTCKILRSLVPDLASNTTVKYEHIFGSDEEKMNAANLLIKITKERKFLLETMKL